MDKETPLRRAQIAPVPPPSPDSADRYQLLLERQIVLADRQIAEIEREGRIRYWSPLVRHTSDVMKAVFQLAIGAGVALLIIAAAVATWNASQARGLVIEPFSVPADFSARGLTGETMASRLLDELSGLQEATDTARPADSYSNNLGQDIKLDIPNTGMSVSEAYRLLVRWLGHETHITGEVWRTAQGIAVKTRVAGSSGATVTGPEADLDKLIRRSAETIYRRTQPYRYATYAGDAGRREEAQAVLSALAADETHPHEQAWAYLGLAVNRSFYGDWRGGVADLYRASEKYPGLASLYVTLDSNESWLGHDEQAYAAAKKAVALLQSRRDTGMSEQARTISLPVEQAAVAMYSGDYRAVLRHAREAIALPDYAALVESSRETIVTAHALLHDGEAARQAWASLPASDDPLVHFSRLGSHFAMKAWLGDWQGVLALEKEADERITGIEKIGGGLKLSGFRETLFRPYLALAQAKLGAFAKAHALIDQTPLDCYLCLRVRGAIAAAEHNGPAAQSWYERAVKVAPSLPAAYADWARLSLARGNADDAIAKARAAIERQPAYADGYAVWGEALVAKNRSDLALAKFAEAAKIAPNWGRLHLKWGEALMWLGRTEEAQRQFATAARLDLTGPERNRLPPVLASSKRS